MAIDAFIIRVLLLPAVLQLVGPATWWFPHWLDWILPPLAVEPHEDMPSAGSLAALDQALLGHDRGDAHRRVNGLDRARDDEDEDPKIEKVLAERGTVLAKYTANGKIVDPGELAVNFPNGGGGQRIVSVEVEMGDQVQKGDVLAIIENADARAQLRAAKAELSGADVGRKSGSAQRAQSSSSVKAARAGAQQQQGCDEDHRPWPRHRGQAGQGRREAGEEGVEAGEAGQEEGVLRPAAGARGPGSVRARPASR